MRRTRSPKRVSGSLHERRLRSAAASQCIDNRPSLRVMTLSIRARSRLGASESVVQQSQTSIRARHPSESAPSRCTAVRGRPGVESAHAARTPAAEARPRRASPRSRERASTGPQVRALTRRRRRQEDSSLYAPPDGFLAHDGGVPCSELPPGTVHSEAGGASRPWPGWCGDGSPRAAALKLEAGGPPCSGAAQSSL